jgi:hypothetical protein
MDTGGDLMERQDCWWALLRSPKVGGRLFAALHAWRAAVLRRKHRYQSPTSDEEALHVALFEVSTSVRGVPRSRQSSKLLTALIQDKLPLHLAVLSLDESGEEAFELLGYVSSRFPAAALSLDAKVQALQVHTSFDFMTTSALRTLQRRSALFYAIRQRWSLEHLEWLAEKSAPLVLEKDSEVRCPSSSSALQNAANLTR